MPIYTEFRDFGRLVNEVEPGHQGDVTWANSGVSYFTFDNQRGWDVFNLESSSITLTFGSGDVIDCSSHNSTHEYWVEWDIEKKVFVNHNRPKRRSAQKRERMFMATRLI